MSAKEPLSQLMGITSAHLTFDEKCFLEADLFYHVCEELKFYFKSQYKQYIRLLKSNIDKENTMLDNDFARLIIKDILLTEEYTLDGIACYANTHTDVVYDIALGYNVSPSAAFVQRVIALHRMVKPEIYRSILKKVMDDYSKAN
jgi:hypothetical protein